METCYAQTTYLVLGEEILDSERGIQQGDPLGPGLFGMAIQKAMEKATNATRNAFGKEALDHVFFFLDDGVAGGTAEAAEFWIRRSRGNLPLWDWISSTPSASSRPAPGGTGTHIHGIASREWTSGWKAASSS